MEVVEHEHQRPRLRQLLEQRAHRPVTAVALVLECDAALCPERRERREDVRELRPHVFVQDAKTIGTQSAQVFVERVHEDRERQVALELRRRAGKDEPSVRVGGAGEFGEKTGLADPGLPDEGDRGGAPLIDPAEHLVERAELLGAADELVS